MKVNLRIKLRRRWGADK